MVYIFLCSNCGTKVEITKLASEYNAKGHLCPSCEEELIRDPDNFCRSSPRNIEGFFGTTQK